MQLDDLGEDENSKPLIYVAASMQADFGFDVLNWDTFIRDMQQAPRNACIYTTLATCDKVKEKLGQISEEVNILIVIDEMHRVLNACFPCRDEREGRVP